MSDASLDVTWIAPVVPALPALSWLDELGQLGQIENVRLHPPVCGDVRRPQIVRALRKVADVIIWSGHGQPGGLCIPSATPHEFDLVTPAWLATYASCALPRVVVLTACGSQARDEHLRSLADEVSRAGLNVIGFPARTDDAAAVTFSVELVQALASGAKLGNAFAVALEAIAGYATAGGVFLSGGLTNGNGELKREIESLKIQQQETLTLVRAIISHMGITEPIEKRTRARSS